MWISAGELAQIGAKIGQLSRMKSFSKLEAPKVIKNRKLEKKTFFPIFTLAMSIHLAMIFARNSGLQSGKTTLVMTLCETALN